MGRVLEIREGIIECVCVCVEGEREMERTFGDRFHGHDGVHFSFRRQSLLFG